MLMIKNLHEIAEMFDISSLRVDQLHNHLAQLLSIGQLSEYEEIITTIAIISISDRLSPKSLLKKIMMTNLLGVSCWLCALPVEPVGLFLSPGDRHRDPSPDWRALKIPFYVFPSLFYLFNFYYSVINDNPQPVDVSAKHPRPAQVDCLRNE